jgi:hypothetical protein
LTDWLAIIVGLAGGMLLCYWAGKALLPPLVERSKKPGLVIKLGLGGTAIAALPALLLAMVAGPPLGSAFGAAGIAAGVAAVFAVVLLAGTFAGVLLAAI